jgi:hypothetical protein
MTDMDSRRGAANLATLLMVVSFAAMIGFLFWLGKTAEGTPPMIMEDTDTSNLAGEEGAVDVTSPDLRTNASAFNAMFVRVSDVDVVSAVGSQAFFIEVGIAGSSNPFLVKLDSALVARGQSLPRGTVTVVGNVLAMTDSIVDAWISAGAVSEGERPVVDFSEYFIEASVIRGPGVMAPAGSGDGAGDGGGEGDR